MILRVFLSLLIAFSLFYWLGLDRGGLPILRITVAEGATTSDGWIVFPASEETAKDFRPDGRTRVTLPAGLHGRNLALAFAFATAGGLTIGPALAEGLRRGQKELSGRWWRWRKINRHAKAWLNEA